MRAELLAGVAAIAAACSRPPPRGVGDPRDLVVVFLPVEADTPAPAGFSQLTEAHLVHTAPAATVQAALTGQWPGTVRAGRPNTLQGVLRLYGYQTVGALPAQWVGADAPWIAEGLDPAPVAGAACLPEQLEAVAELHPQAPDLAVAAVLAPVGEACTSAEAVAALERFLAGPRGQYTILAVVGLSPSAAGGTLPEVDTRHALWLGGAGYPPQASQGLATVVDLLPSLLPEAKAVVPSDATGSELRQVVLHGAPRGAPAVFLQDTTGTLAVRTREHLLWVPAVTEALPEAAPPAATMRAISGTPVSAEREAALYGVLFQWDRQRRAASASDRMGNDAFRDMLRDQGYWH